MTILEVGTRYSGGYDGSKNLHAERERERLVQGAGNARQQSRLRENDVIGTL